MAFFKASQFKPPFNNDNRSFDSVSTTFKRNLNATDIAALKVTVEAGFAGIAFNYSGLEFDYDVSLSGPEAPYRKAMNYLFPKGRSDIIVEPFETLPSSS